jgi:hypothetical protein
MLTWFLIIITAIDNAGSNMNREHKYEMPDRVICEQSLDALRMTGQSHTNSVMITAFCAPIKK